MKPHRPFVLAPTSFVLLELILAFLPVTAAAASGTTHVVQPGDTLASIAAAHGVTTSALIRANAIADPDLIQIGQRLTVPGSSSASVPPQPSGQTTASTYVVRLGQTLSQIADELDLSASAIARVNGLSDPDLIRAGRVLWLPASPRDGAPAEALGDAAGPGTRFVASISDQRCWLYVNGELAGNGRCSTGRSSAPTVPGSYTIQSKINPAYASTWDFWMPYWLGIYYAGSSENGIHGLPYDPETGRKTWEGLVGTPITYGCIMLDNENAKRVYEAAYIGMPVIVLP